MKVLIQWEDKEHVYKYPLYKILKKMKFDVTEDEVIKAAKQVVSEH